jgi:hypothetical protein
VSSGQWETGDGGRGTGDGSGKRGRVNGVMAVADGCSGLQGGQGRGNSVGAPLPRPLFCGRVGASFGRGCEIDPIQRKVLERRGNAFPCSAL